MNSFYCNMRVAPSAGMICPAPAIPSSSSTDWAAPRPMNIPASFVTLSLAGAERFSSIYPAAVTAISLSTTATKLPTRPVLWLN